MADTPGRASASLTQKLRESPELLHSFDFFQLGRLLQLEQRTSIGAPDATARDLIRFGQWPFLKFVASAFDVEHTRTRNKSTAAGESLMLYVNFLGLLGPNGPMPLWLTEYALDREEDSDYALVDFLNVFHSRVVSLFFRAWACNQKAVDLDRPEQARFPLYLGSFIGLGMEPLMKLDAELGDWSKIYYSGRLVDQTRNAEGLEAILEDDLGIPVAVQPARGYWVEAVNCIGEHAQGFCQLGASERSGTLGHTTLLGTRFLDYQLQFRIRLGPMNLTQYVQMLPFNPPEGYLFRRLSCWVSNYLGPEFLWDVQYVLKGEEVPGIHLGKADALGGWLGWTSWLKPDAGKPFGRDPDDLVVTHLES